MLEANKIYRARNISGVISTDDIIPAHYKHKFSDVSLLAQHIFENKYPNFASSINESDVIICNNTFGIGSSREQAVSALLGAGVSAVIAPNFGRIFFRNSWNLGLIAIEADLSCIQEFAELKIDLNKGLVTSNNMQVRIKPIPKEMLNFLHSGGLLNYIKKKLETKSKSLNNEFSPMAKNSVLGGD